MPPALPRTAEDDELARIASRERTVKWLILSITACVIVWKLSDTWVELQEKSPWVTLGLSLITALVPASGLMYVVILKVKWFTSRVGRRNAELELRLDPSRESSGLREDGTDPQPGEAP